MYTFYFEFLGREKHAIGINSNFNKSVQANSYDEAVIKLYETHEHITIRFWSQWEGHGVNIRRVGGKGI